MLTDDQLTSLLEDLESDRVERTISLRSTDKFGEAICAFANDMPGHDNPGYLLIGVNDDGTPSGLGVTDAWKCASHGLRGHAARHTRFTSC